MIPLAAPADWMKSALCAQCIPDLWFPERGGPTRTAREICRQCPVVAECLEYALVTEQAWGIWAGTTERHRRNLIARRHQRNRICGTCGIRITGQRRRVYCSDECADAGHLTAAAESGRRRRRERGAA